MTPEQHNKYIAYSNIAYGGLFAFFILLMMGFMWAMITLTPGGPGGPPPIGVMIFMTLFMGVIYGSMIIPSFVAGWALLKRKKWAKVAAIIAAVVAGASFPFGTAVCVYTLWFVFSDQGKNFFNQSNQYALPPGRQTWANENWQQSDPQRQPENQYQPPPAPPDWR